MARQEPTSYRPNIPTTGDWMKDFFAVDQAVSEESAEALDRYAETGDLKGAFYKAPYADSYATYRVTKLRPFTVQHVDCGDGWHLPAPHVRGLTAKDVEASLRFDLRMRELRKAKA